VGRVATSWDADSTWSGGSGYGTSSWDDERSADIKWRVSKASCVLRSALGSVGVRLTAASVVGVHAGRRAIIADNLQAGWCCKCNGGKEGEGDMLILPFL